jgi:hypothetical protein
MVTVLRATSRPPLSSDKHTKYSCFLLRIKPRYPSMSSEEVRGFVLSVEITTLPLFGIQLVSMCNFSLSNLYVTYPIEQVGGNFTKFSAVANVMSASNKSSGGLAEKPCRLHPRNPLGELSDCCSIERSRSVALRPQRSLAVDKRLRLNHFLSGFSGVNIPLV